MKRIVVVVLMGAAPASSWAQSAGGAVAGIVRDEQGGVINGAFVDVACGATMLQGVSDERGEFRFVDLPAGRCTVTAESQEFLRSWRTVTVPASDVHLVLPVRGFASDVVVTATRGQRESAFAAPQAVSVVGADDLRSRPFTLLAQSLRDEAGVLIQQTTTAQTSPVIRGFTGQQNVYLVDGVRLNTASWRSGPSQYFAWIDSTVADRLEIVRGPASVQYGSDALGGTVHVLPVMPTVGSRSVAGEVDYSGALADRSSSGSAHVELRHSAAAVRIGISRQRVGNLRGGEGRDSHAAVTRFLGLPSKEVFGTRMPSTGFDQSAGYLSGVARAGANGTVTVLYLHNSITGSSRYDRIDGGAGVYRSGFDPQGLDFAVLRYAHRHDDSSRDWSAAISLNRQADGRYEQTRPTAVFDTQHAVTTAWGYQFDAGQRVGSHQLRSGVELYRESVDAARAHVTLSTGASVAQRPDIPDGSTYDSFGVFVSDAVQFGKVGVRGGVRYGRYDFATVADTAHPAFGVVDEHVTMNAVTFNAGATYSLTRALNATFNVSRGFRAANASDLGAIGLSGGGGFEVAPSRAAALGGLVGSTSAVGAVSLGKPVPGLRPEVLYAFEPGIRFRLGRYSAAATAFDLEFVDNVERRAIVFPTNIVGTVISGYEIVRQDAAGLAYIAQDTRPVGTRINVAHSRFVGFETEGGVDLARNWRARAYFSMSTGRVLDGDYLSKMPPPLGGTSVRWSPGRFWVEGVTTFARAQTRLSAADLSDARVGASRSRTSIASYFNGTAVDLGYVSNGTLTATGETLAQVQQRVLGAATAAPMFTATPGFFTVGARGGFHVTDGADVVIIGENLTDRNYRLNGSGADAPGANLQLRLRYRF